MIKLTKANLEFNKLTDSRLIFAALKVHAGLLAQAAGYFPTADLPIALATFATNISTYRTAVSDAIKGSKADTLAKENAKIVVLNNMRAYAAYVNSVAFNTAGSSLDIDSPSAQLQIRAIVEASGFPLSVFPRPVAAGQGIAAPIVRKAISESTGTLKILVRQYTNANRNTLLYQVNYRTSAQGTIPAGDWATQTFTGQNQILVTGLTSGTKYDWQIAAIGGRDAKRNEDKPLNFTPISSVVII